MADTQQIADQTGNDKAHQTAVDAHDAAHGTYDDAVTKVPVEQLLPMQQMPKGPDPSPFTLGPMAPGGRGGE